MSVVRAPDSCRVLLLCFLTNRLQNRRLLIKSITITVAAFLVAGAIVLAARPEFRGTRAGFADENYLKSGDCRSCHGDHYDSWARTYHSRMTREPLAENVQGDFTRNNHFDYLGVKATMEKRTDGFFMVLNLLGAALCGQRFHLAPPRAAQIALRLGAAIMPLGFLLAGIWHYESDPGLAIWLVPPSGLLLVFGAVTFALAARRGTRDAASGV
jgi:hypothetical protein